MVADDEIGGAGGLGNRRVQAIRSNDKIGFNSLAHTIRRHHEAVDAAGAIPGQIVDAYAVLDLSSAFNGGIHEDSIEQCPPRRVQRADTELWLDRHGDVL